MSASSTSHNEAGQRHYAVFISYRHADNKEPGRQWANWLHDTLEGYVVPPELVGTANLRGGQVPASLYPVFRDEAELPADADLANNITQALDRSDLLVVLCSPRAVQSRYVAEEIRYFKNLGRSGRVLALMIDGEPNVTEDAAKPGLECLPEPLRYGAAREDGSVDWSVRVEPIAADVRPQGRPEQGWTSAALYGRELKKRQPALGSRELREAVTEYDKRLNEAVLKIVAGGLGVPFGVLTQRDQVRALAAARRRSQVLMRLAAGFALLALAAAVAGVVAWQMRGKAERSLVKEQAALKQSQESRSDADYRLGNAAMEDASLPEALAFYASSLRNDPANRQARAAALAALYSERGLKWTLPDKIKDLPPQAGSVCIAADGRWLVFDDGKAVHLWSGKDGSALMQWPHSQPLQDLHLTSGPEQLIQWTEKDGRCSLVRPEAAAVPVTAALPAETRSVLLAADLQHLVAVLPSPDEKKPMDLERVFAGKAKIENPEPVLFSRFGSTAAPGRVLLEGKIMSHQISPKGGHWAGVVRRGGGEPDQLELRETGTGKLLQTMPLVWESEVKTSYQWVDDAALLVLEDGTDMSVLSGTERREVRLTGLPDKVVLGTKGGWVALLEEGLVLGRVSAEGRFTQVLEDKGREWRGLAFSEDGEALYAFHKFAVEGWPLGQDPAAGGQRTSLDPSPAATLSAPAGWGRAVELDDGGKKHWISLRDGSIRTESLEDGKGLRVLQDQLAYIKGQEVSVGGAVLAHDSPLQDMGGQQPHWLTAAGGKVYWWSLTKSSHYSYEDAYRSPAWASTGSDKLPAAVAEQVASYGKEAALNASSAPEHRSPSGLFLYTRRVGRCSMIYTDPPDGWTEVSVYDDSGRLQLARQLVPGQGEARLSDDGLHFFTHTTQTNLQVWDLLKSQEMPAANPLPAGEEVLDLASWGAWAVTRDSAGRAWLRPLSGGAEPLPLGEGAESGRAVARGRKLLAILKLKKGMRVSAWDLDDKQRQPAFAQEYADGAAYDFSPDGARVSVAGEQRLRVWDFAQHKLVVDTAMPEGAAGVKPSLGALYTTWAYREFSSKELYEKSQTDYVVPEFTGNGRFIEMDGWNYDIEHSQWLRASKGHSIVLQTALLSEDVAGGLADFLEAAGGLRYEGGTLQPTGLKSRAEMQQKLEALRPGQAALLDDLLRHWLKVEPRGSSGEAWQRVNSFCKKEGLIPPAPYAYGLTGTDKETAGAAEREAFNAGCPTALLDEIISAEAHEDLPKAKKICEQLLQACAERERQGRGLLPWDRLLQARALARLGRLEEAAKAYAGVNPQLAVLRPTNLATLYRLTGIELAWLRGDKEAAFKGLMENPDLALAKDETGCLSVAADGSLSLRSVLAEVRRAAPPLPPEVLELRDEMIWQKISAALEKPTPEGLQAVVKTLRNLLRYSPPDPAAVEPMQNREPEKRKRYLDLARAYELLKQPAERRAALADYEALLRTVMDNAEKNGVVDDDLWIEVAGFQEAKGDKAECIGAWRKAVEYKGRVAGSAVKAALRLGDREAAEDFFQIQMREGDDPLHLQASHGWFLDAEFPTQAVRAWRRLEDLWQSPRRREMYGCEYRTSYLEEAYPATAELESKLVAAEPYLQSRRWSWLIGLAHDALRRGQEEESRARMAEVLAIWPFFASDEFEATRDAYDKVLGGAEGVKAAVARLRSVVPAGELAVARARGFGCGAEDVRKPEQGLALLEALPASPGRDLARADLLTLARRWKEAAAAWLALPQPAALLSPQRENMLLCARELCQAGDTATARTLYAHAQAAPTLSHADICLQAWLALELGEDAQAQRLFAQALADWERCQKKGGSSAEGAEGDDSYLDLRSLHPEQLRGGHVLASWLVRGRKETARLVREGFAPEIKDNDLSSTGFARSHFDFGPRSRQLGKELLEALQKMPAEELATAAGEAGAFAFLTFAGRTNDAKNWQAEHPGADLSSTVKILLERGLRGDALKALKLLREAPPPAESWSQMERQTDLARAEEAAGEAEAACDRLFKLLSSDQFRAGDLAQLWPLARGLGRTAEFAKLIAPLTAEGKTDGSLLLYACRVAWEERRYDEVVSTAQRRLDRPVVNYDKEDEAQRWQALRYRLAALWRGQGAKAAHEALAEVLARDGGRLSKDLTQDTEPERLRTPLTELQKSWAALTTEQIRELAGRGTFAGSTVHDRLSIMFDDLKRYGDALAEVEESLKTAAPAKKPRLLSNKAVYLRLSSPPRLEEALKAAREAKALDEKNTTVCAELMRCLLASQLKDEAAEEALHYLIIGKEGDTSDLAISIVAELSGEADLQRVMKDADKYGPMETRRHFYAAEGLQNRGDHADALRHLDEAAKDPEWKLRSESAAVASLWLLGRKEEALGRYRHVLEQDATFVGDAGSKIAALRARAELFQALKAKAQSEAAAWSAAATTDEAKMDLSYLLHTLGLKPQARAVEEKLIHRPEYAYNLLIVWMATGEMAKAQDLARSLLNQQGAQATHCAWAGYALGLMGLKDEALAGFEQLIKESGPTSDVLKQRAWLRWNLGMADEALGDMKKSMALQSIKSEAGLDHLGHAGILWSLGRKAEAFAAFRLAVEDDPSLLKPDAFKNSPLEYAYWPEFEQSSFEALRQAMQKEKP